MFHSAHSALAWAYETVNRPIVKLSGANRMREEHGRRMPPEAIQGLSVHEQHAQAAAIIGIAERLPDPACREYIAARFGGMTGAEHVTILMNRIFCSLGTGIHGRRGAYKLLLCYFGVNIGYRAIRYDLKCRDAKVIEIRRTVYDVLDAVGDRAMVEIQGELEGHGLILCQRIYA
ncbi:MAG: hypothetical protein J0I90_02745 [Nitrosospira sp.]|nr:hypothetical protein [Nitrosospira sp.]